MQLQSRLQSPKNCSWIKNRLAAVRQPLSRHWYDCEKLPASSVQYYVPLNLPRHGLTQQQSPAAAQATAGPRAAATRAGTTYCSLLSCISVSSRVELDGRGGVVFPFQVLLRRTMMHRYTPPGQACAAAAGKRSVGRRCRSFRFFSSSAAI